MDLDKLGITVCAIHGTHFTSYVKFARALGIPWAVLTDGDPNETESLGEKRATRLVEALGLTVSPAEAGVFVGPTTFEYDLYQAGGGNTASCVQILRELGTAKIHETTDGWSASAPSAADLIKVVESTGGKGRFAQRLAREPDLVPPQYLGDALRHLCAPT